MSDGRTERARALREERQAQILTAALQTFADKGYHGASITDIVEAAGVARGTFYLYFDSKNAVFLELLEQLLTGFRHGIIGVDVSPEAPPLLDQLVGTIERLLLAATSSRAVATLIFRETGVLDPEVQERVLDFEQRLHTYVEDALARGVRLGLLRQHDTDVVATCVYGAIRQVLYRYVVVAAEAEPDLHAIAREVVVFSLQGVLRT
jgi:AcrR family transcriptional regulator